MSKSHKTPLPKISLPDDLAACHALLEQQAYTIFEIQQEKLVLEQKLLEALQQAFHKRRERYLNDPDQLRLDFGDTPEAADAAEGLAQAVEETQQLIPEHTRRRPRSKPSCSEPFPNVPRYYVDAETPDELKHCPTHGERKLIGYDEVPTLEFQRPKLRVKITRYPKYTCDNHSECGVASPERPTGLVEGNRYDTSVAAEVIAGKYSYHLPIYRQQDYFAGSGWTPSRSTLLNLLTAAAFVIRPLAEHFKQIVLKSGRLGTDDTSVTLLIPKTLPPLVEGDPKSARTYEVFNEALEKKKPSITARMWVYRSLQVPLNVFDFTVSRHRDGPDLFLKDFEGTFVGDCYGGYLDLEERSEGKIRHAACNAHARRKFLEAISNYPLEASQFLAFYQQLYDLEDRAKPLEPQARLELRQREAEAVWASMRAWLESDAAAAVLPKSKLGEAVGYLRNHWDSLRVYLNDSQVPIDNNDSEQLMKHVAIGRRNWLFLGSVDSGERTADFLTLVTSAVRNDLDVWFYVKSVLDALLAGSTDYESLRPDVWKQSHPEAIREYREQERSDRAARQARRRAFRRKSRGR